MMSSLHWLLINVAVVVCDTLIIRYATFENPDMASLCQVGVLAMNKNGITWVIQSNGNGTFSITWSEYLHKWETNKIKINDWMDSVDGTTLEGAVGLGNLTNDEMLDKCYDVRDAVVGYLSGRNHSSSMLTVQTCPANKRYCGHNPEVQAMVRIGHSQRHKLLISCDDDGRVAGVDICDRNCTSGDKAGEARCQCLPDKWYCAHELSAVGGWMDYDSHILYQCQDENNSVVNLGNDISIRENCSNGCIATGNNSICSGYCNPFASYCGHELLKMGWKGYDPDTIYECQPNGESFSQLAKSSLICPEACVQKSVKAFCQCHPGRFYCLNELVTKLNWWWMDDEYPIDQHNLCQCLPEKNRVTRSNQFHYDCINCTASQGEKDAYCQWTPGIHCGRALNAMVSTGYDDDTLYQCGKDEKSVAIISKCLSDTCKQNGCDCIPDRTYCGHQLYLMGWRKQATYKNDTLMQCTKGGKNANGIIRCKKCTSSSGGPARCAACMETERYCGHELDANLPSRKNALYRCNNQGTTSLVKACKKSCLRVEGEPVCQGECFPGDTYCGSKLLKLGFTGYNNNSIYSCSTDGQTFNDTGLVDSLCIQCTPGQSYCGHQLQEKQYISEANLQFRYECQTDGSLNRVVPCDNCISSSTGAFCRCIPGQYFCGVEVKNMGWNDFEETFHLHSNFTDDTLFRCSQQHKIEVVEQCPNQQCMSPSSGLAYCMCTPHRTYCGHQLNPNYNSLETYLNLNNIYQCSDDQGRVIAIRQCGSTCVSINGQPECLQQCVHGSRYCGLDLLHMEGWTGLESNVLYQCTNGSFASPELNCTQGCRDRNADVDAYCLGMPTPWYWILLATALPLLFISLCIWLIRTIIKHRRLEKFVQQHRINASQLTLVLKLGHGQFGEVWQARYTEQIPNGQQIDVAVKISKHHLNTNDGLNLASANCFFQESVALDFLRHENITRALGICSNLKMASGITTPALVLEYMDGGNSADYILKEREHLQTSDLMKIFNDICQAGEHLQKMGVIHRDIGARNVLVRKHSRNGKPAVAKLTDFGLAKDIGKSAGIYKSTIGDRAMFHEGYTAPEGFRGEVSSQSDVWSFGVFMWELYMLMDRNLTEPLAPYSDIASQDILREIGKGYRLRRPLMAPDYIYSIMTSCWTWMPESRPTFRQLRKTLQPKRTRNGVEAAKEMVPQETCRVTAYVKQREEETAFSPNGGYGRPN